MQLVLHRLDWRTTRLREPCTWLAPEIRGPASTPGYGSPWQVSHVGRLFAALLLVQRDHCPVPWRLAPRPSRVRPLVPCKPLFRSLAEPVYVAGPRISGA